MYSITKKNLDSNYTLTCSECGKSHFRYERDVVLGGFDFAGYTCMTCGNLMFMDKEALQGYSDTKISHIALTSRTPKLLNFK
jgi:DNA-directed RNA polymerase subunit RPC12/RpoP